MNYKKIILTIIIVTLSAIYSAALGWIFQFFAVGLTYYYGSLYLLSKGLTKNKNIVSVLSLGLPFTILYGYVFFDNPNPNLKVLPILVVPIISCSIAYYTFIKNNKKKYIIFYSTLIALATLLGMPNWIYYISDTENPINKPFPDLAMKDIHDNSFSFKKGKVIIIDLWSSSCGVCIKKFPDFEKLKLKYKNDDRIEFYTLNEPLERDSIIDVKKYVKDYKFQSLFAINVDESREKLDNRSVPKFLILDKSKNIVYKGFLYDKWYDMYNNIDNLIEKYINE